AGDRFGRQLGFPTANLDVTGMTLPPNGVYAAATLISGRFYQAALNIGLRPTLSSPAPQLRVEAHLLDFEGDLYGSEIEIEPGQKLRDERKFSSRDELSHQIGLDVAAVRLLL
ncbi:MAG TPA: riboflavin kinase, partial [Candidatus Angelobacter sp.]|nr:riboflavin kinase [Candidatus Angelobacter sp.]